MKLKLVTIILGISFTGAAFAQDQVYIPVGSAKTKKTVIAFTDVREKAGSESLQNQRKSIFETVQSDLSFMDLFKFLEPSAFLENSSKAGIAPGTFKMTDWSTIGADFLIKAEVSVEPQGLSLDAYLYDTQGNKAVLAKRYLATIGDTKVLAHSFANDIVTALTGLPGIFLTRIAMTCDRTKKKEIYVMDFDGTHIKQLTHHGSVAFAPAWSPDGTKIAYSLISKNRANIKNINLFEFNMNNNSIRLLSDRKGINSGAAYNPNGRSMVLTMSFLGNPEIFSFDPSNSSVTRLTRSFGVEVDPTWSPDGKSLAFVSSRAGMPMIYRMSGDGTNVQRLTYAGRYNATPTWSPQNNKIGFAGWIDRRFDIFTMNPDGTNIERLTKSQGNNEDPFFSPDGNFLVFSSNRTGQQNIYVMNVDGTFVKRLTYGLGNCMAPKWSNPPVKQ